MTQPKSIFIELHDRYDYYHKIIISIYAIESIESNRVNLHDKGYDVAETYDEIKMKLETAMKLVGESE